MNKSMGPPRNLNADTGALRPQEPQSPNAARNAEIIRLREAGVGPREIARRLGLSPSTVAGVFHRAGIREKGPHGGGPGMSLPPAVREQAITSPLSSYGAAEALGIAASTVRRLRIQAQRAAA